MFSPLAAGGFPQVDPIPLPAPVWLFKALHELTLALHFCAMFWMVGALVLGVAWNAAGHARRDRVAISASGVIATRLPLLMVYVINLGVPPLLFAQVLYGRAIYSSSVLIGAWWIAVIPLLILGYYLLYLVAGRAGGRRPWWGWALGALIVILLISKIYSMNMTLMLRPGVWAQMYGADQMGSGLPTGDATLMPRWLFMVLSAMAFGGMGVTLFALKGALGEETRGYLRRWGGRVALVSLVLAGAAGVWAFLAQPVAVRDGVMANGFFKVVTYLWPATLLLALGAAFDAARASGAFGWGRAAVLFVPGFLWVTVTVLVRSAVRDVTLAGAGYNVWDRVVTTNWGVVSLFLLVFVLGLGFVGWLAMVAKGAKPAEEDYA